MNVVPYFWATHAGVEIDLFWQNRGKNYAVEVKYADAPKMTASMGSALKDLDLSRIWVLYPGSARYQIHERIIVVLMKELSSIKF